MAQTIRHEDGEKKKSKSRLRRFTKRDKSSRSNRQTSENTQNSNIEELDVLGETEKLDERDEDRMLSKRSKSFASTKRGQAIMTTRDAGLFPPSYCTSWDTNEIESPILHNPSIDPMRKTKKSMVVLKEAPSAKDSAYSGPPRYDWIDIETAAALKLQSIYRRNKVLNHMESAGTLTAGMRNRQRRSQAKKTETLTDDVPMCFQMCGIGHLFGDAAEEDEETLKAIRREEYEEKRRKKLQREATQRKYKWRQRDTEEINEGFEVVDDVELR